MPDYATMNQYVQMRQAHPERRALDVWNYLHRDEAMSFEQFTCRHEWVISEEDDRCYCCYCLADGDA
jgi:hypothetical protein